jgi:hypothetical protein
MSSSLTASLPVGVIGARKTWASFVAPPEDGDTPGGPAWSLLLNRPPSSGDALSLSNAMSPGFVHWTGSAASDTWIVNTGPSLISLRPGRAPSRGEQEQVPVV